MTKSEQSTGLGVVGVAETNPMSFFSGNVDSWGAAEWFDRLAKAIREQDKAAVAMHRASGDDKDDHEIRFETYRNIASSSAMRLVREFEFDVRAALAPSMTPTTHPATGDVLEALVRLTKDAGEVSSIGAVTGRQWTLLAGSLILARAAISKSEALALTTPEDQQ